MIGRDEKAHYINQKGQNVLPQIAPLPELTDVELMQGVCEDDEFAFADLYERHYARLQNFFYGMCRDVHVSADLCQETFLRIWKLRKRYKGIGSFPAYMFAIARNIWFERQRSNRKHQRLGVRLSHDGIWDTVAASPRHQPDNKAIHSEIREEIFNALETLPEEQRMAFILRTVEGLSLAEIASVMGCPENTVRSRKLTALKKLRKMLGGVFAE